MNLETIAFFASNYFDYQGFAHQKLFVNNLACWEALDGLDDYLEGFLFEICSPIRADFFENRERISIGKDCKIGPFVHIEGPCIIGNGCEIRSGALIRGGSVIGDNCVIGHGTEIVRSIVLNRSKLPHNNYVGDSIIGNGVNMGAGSICANLRLNKKEIGVWFEGKKILTGRKKLGAIIGDGVSVGCNAVLNPGTILSPGVQIEPLKTIKGVVM